MKTTGTGVFGGFLVLASGLMLLFLFGMSTLAGGGVAAGGAEG